MRELHQKTLSILFIFLLVVALFSIFLTSVKAEPNIDVGPNAYYVICPVEGDEENYTIWFVDEERSQTSNVGNYDDYQEYSPWDTQNDALKFYQDKLDTDYYIFDCGGNKLDGPTGGVVEWFSDFVEWIENFVFDLISDVVNGVKNFVLSSIDFIKTHIIGYDTDEDMITGNAEDGDPSHPDYDEGDYDGLAGLVAVNFAGTGLAVYALPIAIGVAAVIMILVIYVIIWVVSDVIPFL